MRLPGKDWPVSGSFGVGEEQPAMVGPLKSPARSAAVGTNALRVRPRFSRFHSWEKKKWSLSLMMGPPMVAPKSFESSGPLGWPAFLRK